MSISVLRKAFDDAVLTDQTIATNPAARAKRPRVDTIAGVADRVWTRAQLRAFLTVAESDRLHALFHLAAYTHADPAITLRV